MYAVGIAAVIPGVLRQAAVTETSKRYGLLGELARVGGIGIVSAMAM